MKSIIVKWVCSAALLALLGARAEARDPSGDLKRQLDAGRAAVADLERLDDRRGVSDELALLRTWYDEAGNWLAKEEFDRVREVLDRTTAQSELIRQKITASKLTAQANERDAQHRALRARIDQTKQAHQQAQVKKQAMEMNAK
jgi:hypothetical protein